MTRTQMVLLIQEAGNTDPNFKIEWDLAVVRSMAKGIDWTQLDIGEALRKMAEVETDYRESQGLEPDGVMTWAQNMWEMSAEQDQKFLASQAKKAAEKANGTAPKALHDFIVPGEPLLLVSEGSEYMAQDASRLLGFEPVMIDSDIMPDGQTIEQAFNATAPDAVVIFIEAHRALPEVSEKIISIMKDPTRAVVVCVRESTPMFDPHVFAHQAKF